MYVSGNTNGRDDCAEIIGHRLADLAMHKMDITHGGVLERGCVYIIPLLESLALPRSIVAAANPKSSTGRLDVFTRVIADGTRRFDMIGAGYHGPLYAEISPKTFPVLLREGSRLSQVRFRTGHATLDADELEELHAAERLERELHDGGSMLLRAAQDLHHAHG